MSQLHTSRKPAIVFVVTMTLAAFASPAWAYLDPGTGSMIISAIVGLFATAGLAIKTYWYKLKNLLRRDTRVARTTPESPADAPADQPAEPGQPNDH